MNKTKNPESSVRRSILTPGEVHLREAAEGESASRTITGYAVLFDTPSAPLWDDEDSSAREIIARGSITRELLDGCDIKFTMYHDRQLILGRSNRGEGTLKYFVDDRGVGFTLELPSSPNGDEALALVKRGDLSGCSFAFSTFYCDPAYVSREQKITGSKSEITYTVRKITGVYDFTLAADPAYPDTEVQARELDRAITSGAEAEADKAKIAAQLRQMRRSVGQTII